MVKHPNIVTMLGYSVTVTQWADHYYESCWWKELAHPAIWQTENDGMLSSYTKFWCILSMCMQMSVEQKLEISKGIAAGVQYMHHHYPITYTPRSQATQHYGTYSEYERKIIFIQTHIGDKWSTQCLHLQLHTIATTHVVGTYPYMPPEMFDKSYMDTAVDIYSLGCLYIELFGEKSLARTDWCRNNAESLWVLCYCSYYGWNRASTSFICQALSWMLSTKP